MMIKNIPADLNVEELIDYLPSGATRVVFRGRHARNSHGDILGLQQTYDGRIQVELARNSIYHGLPEYVFHPIDRFDSLPPLEEKERFAEELEKQEQEKEDARRFFEPFDLMLLQLRMEVRKKLREWTDTDKVLLDMLSDRLTDEQKANPFISSAIRFLPSCRIIRGNTTLLTLMLRNVFLAEGMRIDRGNADTLFHDELPTTYDISEGSLLGECYAGNAYMERANAYVIHYWDDERCDEHFKHFVEQVEGFRTFVEDYFLAVGDLLRFDIVTDAPPPRLNDNIVYNYLGYNTNL